MVHHQSGGIVTHWQQTLTKIQNLIMVFIAIGQREHPRSKKKEFPPGTGGDHILGDKNAFITGDSQHHLKTTVVPLPGSAQKDSHHIQLTITITLTITGITTSLIQDEAQHIIVERVLVQVTRVLVLIPTLIMVMSSATNIVMLENYPRLLAITLTKHTNTTTITTIITTLTITGIIVTPIQDVTQHIIERMFICVTRAVLIPTVMMLLATNTTMLDRDP